MTDVNVFVHVPKCAGGTIGVHIENQFSYEQRFGPSKPYYKKKILNPPSIFGNKKRTQDSMIVKRSKVEKYLTSLSAVQKSKITCVYGHAAYFGIHLPLGREAKYYTFLREPVARFISYYNYISSMRVTPERLKRNEIQKPDGSLRSIEEWLEAANLNLYSMSAFLLHICQAENLLHDFNIPTQEDMHKVKKMLDSFYFVGITEYKTDMDFVLGSLGIDTFLPNKNVLQEKETYKKPQDMHTARKIIESKCPFDVELYEYAKKLNAQQKEQISTYQNVVEQTKMKREAHEINNT